jgi:hypothetical protein
MEVEQLGPEQKVQEAQKLYLHYHQQSKKQYG